MSAPADFILPPGGVIGILGGGQLGRMLSLAAARLGLRTHIYSPEQIAPAYDVSAAHTVAAYDDDEALRAFAQSVDVVTYEFENVPAAAIDALIAAGAEVAPGGEALEVAQDRLVEKQFVQKIGAQTAPFHAVDDLASLAEGLEKIGRPAVLKTRRLGYDGKGQTVLREDDGDLQQSWEAANEKAWTEIGAKPAILEGWINFVCEISVIGARARNGEIALYDPAENSHSDGILRQSQCPARIAPETMDQARHLTAAMLETLDYVGVIGVEFFVRADGSLLINEFAPRVHNSGHWTEAACAISQFEQHIRAVAGWPLGATARHSNAAMDNLIGAEADQWRALASEPGVVLNLYGKREARAGRKMGHVTRLSAIK